MDDQYDESIESSYLQYLDVNNLYGFAMTQPLPTGGFKWMNDIDSYKNPDIIDILSKRKDKGYILEVDVEYPKELHDKHNDLPFLTEKMKINKVEKLVAI